MSHLSAQITRSFKVLSLGSVALSAFAAGSIALSASAQQVAPVASATASRAISEAEFMSDVSGGGWLFDQGVGSASYDYAALTASPMQGVPTYVSPANAPAPTDQTGLATAVPARPAPVAPLRDLGTQVAATTTGALPAPPTTVTERAMASGAVETAQATTSALDEVIAGADTPALPAYLNPENQSASSSSSSSSSSALAPLPPLPSANANPSLGALPPLAPLPATGAATASASASAASGLGDLPALPALQNVNPAPLPPSLNSVGALPSLDGTESVAVTGGEVPGFDPYQFTNEQAAVIDARNGRTLDSTLPTVEQQNQPIGDLPPLPPIGDVRVDTQNARTLNEIDGTDGDLAFLEQRLASVGIADEDLVVQVGAQVGARPEYIGSDDFEIYLQPVIDIEYMDRFFVSTQRGVGVKLIDNDMVDASLFGTWRRGRSDVANMNDLDGGIALGAEVGFEFGPVRLSVNGDWAASGDIGGVKADIDASLKQGFGALITEIHGGVRVADEQYIRDQFLDTGMDNNGNNSSFDPSAGIVDVHGGVAASYFVTPNWAVNAEARLSILLDDAADSLIVDQDGSATQYQGSLGVTYRF